MKTLKTSILFIFLFVNILPLNAQNSIMADTMRTDGKIYVVVAVASIVVLVLGLFMINLDRKVSRIEKKVNSDL